MGNRILVFALGTFVCSTVHAQSNWVEVPHNHIGAISDYRHRT